MMPFFFFNKHLTENIWRVIFIPLYLHKYFLKEGVLIDKVEVRYVKVT